MSEQKQFLVKYSAKLVTVVQTSSEEEAVRIALDNNKFKNNYIQDRWIKEFDDLEVCEVYLD